MWVSDVTLLQAMIPCQYIPWLEKPYRLADALRRVCHELCVQVLYQGDGPLAEEERDYLRLPITEHRCYVRKVLLTGDNVPFCFAYIIIPYVTYHQYEPAFLNLGQRLFGDTLLYANSKTTRSVFQYGLIPAEGIDYDPDLKGCLPARRSIFYMDGIFPVLITESFLAKIPCYQE